MGNLVKSIRPNCPVLYCKGRTVIIHLIELNQGLNTLKTLVLKQNQECSLRNFIAPLCAAQLLRRQQRSIKLELGPRDIVKLEVTHRPPFCALFVSSLVLTYLPNQGRRKSRDPAELATKCRLYLITNNPSQKFIPFNNRD